MSLKGGPYRPWLGGEVSPVTNALQFLHETLTRLVLDGVNLIPLHLAGPYTRADHSGGKTGTLFIGPDHHL